MYLNGWAATALVIGYIGFALITAAALAGIAYALTKLNARLEELIGKADPLLAKTDQILTVTNEKVASLGDRAEGILTQGEETAESVHHKVDKTATAVQRTIHAPIIGLNSLAAGVSRGVETFGKLQRGVVSGAATPAGVRKAVSTTESGQGSADRVPVLAGKEIRDGG